MRFDALSMLLKLENSSSKKKTKSFFILIELVFDAEISLLLKEIYIKIQERN